MRNGHKADGFTLLELLLTVAMLASSMSVILSTYVYSLALNDASRNLTTAVTHAEYVLEDIRNTAFANIAANISASAWNWSAATITGKGMSALNSETIVVTSSGTNPLDVTVTVNWHDLNNRIRTRAITTSVSG